MTDLWAERRNAASAGVAPLAARMRPRTLEEVVGQGHILGAGKLLRRMLAADALTSLILFGPPGTGKTTLAEVIAGATSRHFERENAAAVGVARVREIVRQAEERLAESGRRTVLFLDEIHRFTRAQQDVLLGDVERGLLTLIGATTENPLFAVNSALVSRSTLLRLEPLTPDDIRTVLRRAIDDRARGYGGLPLRVTDEALDLWAVKSDGDARRALTALEVAVRSQAPAAGPAAIVIDRAVAEDSIQQKAAVYDGSGDEHFDAISAMIKSIRGSDPDAALYWVARMLEAGEDPRYVARRLAVLASEDIGNADPRAVMLAASCWELVERVGMPECRITLAQCVCYLALAPKSNASYVAIEEAIKDVREGRTVAVPSAVKDGNVKKAAGKSAGAAKGDAYVYTHGLPTVAGVGGVSGQDYLGISREYYRPGDMGVEAVLSERLAAIRAARRQARAGPAPARPGGEGV
ncbi:MAG: replication-associated recombination protein A [Phycisphaerae bacterium]|nr:replication-associated recombination protein A [Phycisphaerae bacterium]